MSETPDESPDDTSIRSERVTIGQPRKDALCGASTSAGTPCRRRPMKGGKRCLLHGGASPLARQAAERRLLYGVSLALDRLIDAVSEHEHEGPCELCGCSPLARDAVVIRAALGVLDRSGFGPGLRLQHSNEEDDQGIREIRVNIVEVSAEQRERDQASDRAALAERNARYNQELEEREPTTTDGEHADTDGKNAISIDLEAY